MKRTSHRGQLVAAVVHAADVARLRRALLCIGITLGWSGCSCASQIVITPPRVPQGGRAVAISVAPSDAKRIVVATETGGLFRTFDGGVSFQHLDAFPDYATVDVAIASLDPNTIIATARDDFHSTSGGGIWRSTDGGGSWSRPGGWPPPPSGTCIDHAAASGISHMPLTRTFYVATDCGIAVSNDDGATFTLVLPDSADPAVRAVLVLNRTTGVAATSNHLFFLQNGRWTRSTGGPTTGSVFSTHSLASPYWAAPSIFYHMGRDATLYESSDAGATWVIVPIPKHGPNREPFIRVGRGLDGDPTHIDLYMGDGFSILREPVTTVLPLGDSTWKAPDHVDHEDPNDVAFTPGFDQPLMLATDGGVHLTPDSGRTWTVTGANFGGFTALQIAEITGRFVQGAPAHQDLYYGTQDNDAKGSHDGGLTWDGSVGGDDAFLRADAMNPAAGDIPVVGMRCCQPYVVPPHMGSTNDPPPFPSAPNGQANSSADHPEQLIDSTFIQSVANMGTPATFDFFLTRDFGTSWAPAFSLAEKPLGTARFAGDLNKPVGYIGVDRGSFAGLYRVADVTAQATVRAADSTGIAELGIVRTGPARYVVFGVDPKNANHLLAPDIGPAQDMKASDDGGVSWFSLPGLTAAVSDSGKFRMSMGPAPFASAVAWDPANSCHILIGTMQNGVIRSTDGGLTWKRVDGSAVATTISSFYFPPSGEIWLSTYGRGLWRLTVDRRPPTTGRCSFPTPPGKTTQPVPPVILARRHGPSVFVLSTARSGTSSMVQTGDTVAVFGYGFAAGSGTAGVAVTFGTDTVARRVTVGRDGRFSMRLPLNAGPGILSVTARQGDGKNAPAAHATVSVVGRS